MHKRNIFLATVILAGAATAACTLSETIKHSDLLGMFYFPAIFLAVVFSGGKHTPSSVALWSAFLSYTFIYLLAFLIIYMVLWQLYLLRKAARHFDADIKRHASRHKEFLAAATTDLQALAAAPSATDLQAALEVIGRALTETEQRYRRHWLLKDAQLLSQTTEPRQLAAIAIVNAGKERQVQGLLKRYEAKLTKEIGKDRATLFMEQLEKEAKHMAPEGGATGAAQA